MDHIGIGIQRFQRKEVIPVTRQNGNGSQQECYVTPMDRQTRDMQRVSLMSGKK